MIGLRGLAGVFHTCLVLIRHIGLCFCFNCVVLTEIKTTKWQLVQVEFFENIMSYID